MLRDYWYPVARSPDLPPDRPLAIELLGEPLVLYRDGAGAPRCLADRCGHRSAPLSLGVVCAGRLECPYHGWQYGAGGACERIPSLRAGEKIPVAAHVPARTAVERSGLVWVWPGAAADADPEEIPAYPQLDAPEWWVVTEGVMDLDIDHALMIENLVDASHVPFTHRALLAQPEQAQPLDVAVTASPGGGLRVVYTPTREPRPRLPDFLAFDPPCHVRVERNDGSIARLWHCLPTARGRMRLIWWIAMRRSALDPVMARKARSKASRRRVEAEYHDAQTRILAQDVAMLLGQQRRLDLSARPFACPVKVDAMALRYRAWREANDGPGVWFDGYERSARETGSTGHAKSKA